MKEACSQRRSGGRIGFSQLFAAAALGFVLAPVAPATAQERADLNRSTDGLFVTQGGPVEGDRVDLQGRFRSFMYATKDADGNLHVGCTDEHPHDAVHGHEEAAE